MKRHTFKIAGAVFLLAAVLCAPATAQRAEVATANVSGGSLYWNVHVGYDGLELTVSGEGRYVAHTFESGETPSFSLFDAEGEPLPDGTYKWELVVLPKLRELKPEEFENLRSSIDGAEVRHARAPERQVASGAFSVRGGQIVNPDLTEGPAAGPAGQGNVLSTKDFVISDDLIVFGSACIGFDCINGENFGFDTIRLKENNLRIKFEDTSAGSFPTSDWEIEINSSASGGASYFRVDDVTAGRSPFTLEANAPSHSLYVDDGGRVGFGTSTPVVDLHVKTGDTPTLRLEQDTSSGFGAQTFDIAGNESNFFVRDATNGSTLPFRIRPGAPTSAIDIAASGNVGVGTASPDASLDVRRSGSGTTVQGTSFSDGAGDAPQNILRRARGSSGSPTAVSNGDNLGLFSFRGHTGSGFSGSRALITAQATESWSAGSNGTELLFSTTANGTAAPTIRFEIRENGDIVANGSIVHSSSREVKESFVDLDPQDVLARVTELPVTAWSYKKDGPEVRHIGPVAEDFFDAFGLGMDSSHVSASDEAGVALVAIQALAELVQEKEGEVEALRKELKDLKQLLGASALEAGGSGEVR